MTLDQTILEGKKSKITRNVSGAEAVILSLLAEQVETIFGYPGGAIMPIYDELYKYSDRLRHILVRHEQGATHAAQGFARVSGEVGVCFATSGPGATNLVTGLADAQIDSNPIVCITGQVPSHLLGSDAFQETDVVSVTMPVTKWNFQVTRPEEIPGAIAKAFFIARTGRPGPVLLDITKDAQLGSLDFEYQPCRRLKSYFPYPKLQIEQVEKAAELINRAEKPFMLVGHGVLLSEAQEEVSALAEKAGIPCASTLLGLSAISVDHPYYTGMLGMHGNYAPNVKTNECDVLIAVGMRFDDRVTGNLKEYARQAQVVHIEIDKSEIHKNVYAHAPVVADAKQALQALLPLIEERRHDAWLSGFRDTNQVEYDKIIHRELYPEGEQIRMGEVVRCISEKTRGEAILVTDVGQHQMVASRYYGFNRPHSNVTSGGLGTMGFALPAAFGAKVAAPEREVVAVIGDGGFHMTIQELGTLMQEGTPVKVIILNNSYLGMVRQWQQLFFQKRYAETEMANPDFVAIARGYRIEAERVEHRPDLDSALDRMLAFDGPFLLEVIVEKEDNVFPMVPSGASVSDIRLE
jgi:acetolactate synthase-1/2/3 large subunit